MTDDQLFIKSLPLDATDEFPNIKPSDIIYVLSPKPMKPTLKDRSIGILNITPSLMKSFWKVSWYY